MPTSHLLVNLVIRMEAQGSSVHVSYSHRALMVLAAVLSHIQWRRCPPRKAKSSPEFQMRGHPFRGQRKAEKKPASRLRYCYSEASKALSFICHLEPR